MSRAWSFALLFTLSAPAFGQTVDGPGAKQLSDNLVRYVGTQALNDGILKISVEGDAYKITFDLKALAAKASKENLAKFDFPPYSLLVKPRGDGSWDVSWDFSTSGSFAINGQSGQRSAQIAIKDGKFTGVYDPGLAAFSSGASAMTSMSMILYSPRQTTDLSVGARSLKFSAGKSANGGVDLSLTQAVAGFAETVKIDNRSVGAIKTSDLAVDISAKAVRTKPLLDLWAFAVAHEDEARLKADQAEFKALLLAALPLWERISGTYTLKDFAFETYAGNFGATKLSIEFGADGIAQNGKLDYAVKASNVSFPYAIPGWAAGLLPTEFDLKFGGSNINLESAARKTIESFDLYKNPPLPVDFRDQVRADFMAGTPKFIVNHSVVKNGGTEIALEGEMTFSGNKPDASFTFDAAGYDKIVESLQAAAKSEFEAARYLPFVLAAQGLGKKLPDGRLEWVINAKADGSVTVNGAMLKPADR